MHNGYQLLSTRYFSYTTQYFPARTLAQLPQIMSTLFNQFI